MNIKLNLLNLLKKKKKKEGKEVSYEEYINLFGEIDEIVCTLFSYEYNPAHEYAELMNAVAVG